MQKKERHLKFEILNPKHETIPKSKIQMFKTRVIGSTDWFGSFGFEEFGYCFETGNPPKGWESEGQFRY